MVGLSKYGAKTYLGCSLIFGDALTYPGTHYFIGRHNLIDLKKFTTPSIHEVFNNWGLEAGKYIKFNGQENYFEIYNGSRVYYMDCKYLPSDPDFHRFGSLQFTRGWIEEIGQVHSLAIVNLSASAKAHFAISILNRKGEFVEPTVKREVECLRTPLELYRFTFTRIPPWIISPVLSI